MAQITHIGKTHGDGLDLRVSLDFLIQREDTAFSSKSKAVTNKHGLRYLRVSCSLSEDLARFLANDPPGCDCLPGKRRSPLIKACA